MNIKSIHARQILDSRGNPTVEADVTLEDGSLGRCAVPSGASTGINEALELRDEDLKHHRGKGVLKAISNVNEKISKLLVGEDALDQEKIDQKMIDLDGTENEAKLLSSKNPSGFYFGNKSNLGANAILAVSVATANAVSVSQHIPFFERLGKIINHKGEYLMPVPMMNIINGGKHASYATDIQEYMILPLSARDTTEALRMGTDVFHALAEVLKKAGYSTNVGDEGGYAPLVKNGNEEPLELISEAVKLADLKLGEDIYLALDCAASEFFEDGKYHLRTENKSMNVDELIAWYEKLVSSYPILSIEDGLDQEDWTGWEKMTRNLGDIIQIVGDDLFVTNLKFLKKGIEEKSANAILIKLNQIGTLTETINTVEMAKRNGWNSIISHRSGETEDTTIAHLSVALSTGQIKSGSLCRTDRVCKYNELMRIEEILGSKAKYKGKEVFKKWLG